MNSALRLRFCGSKFRALLYVTLHRGFATAPGPPFVSPAAQETVHDPKRVGLPMPDSHTFYTGRSNYYDHIATLEQAVHHTRGILRTLHLVPLPEFARRSLPPLIPVWKNKDGLSEALETKLSATAYRRLVELLNQLNDFRRIAKTAGHMDLAGGIESVLDMFERDNKEAHLLRGKRKSVQIDESGRSYTVGRRKTSSARVWIISSEHSVQSAVKLADPISLPTTQILINNVPLNKVFPVPADRERILRPFNLTGLLGAYHVFALVRGGGTSGRSGAVAHGIAKGLAAQVPEVEPILRRAKLLRRDPRMVERKKTGRAKARKRYAWVKR